MIRSNRRLALHTLAASAALALLPVMWGRSGAVFAAYRNNSFGWSGPHVSTAALWTRTVWHSLACQWARIDGKSPVDYLDDNLRAKLRSRLSREFLEQVPIS